MSSLMIAVVLPFVRRSRLLSTVCSTNNVCESSVQKMNENAIANQAVVKNVQNVMSNDVR
jgi:hypothetical protein